MAKPKTGGVEDVSFMTGNVQYTPFHAHASLDRAKSNNPWGMRKQTRQAGTTKHGDVIVEEESIAETDKLARPSAQETTTINKEQVLANTNRSSSVGQINWLFFIMPTGILMVLEIGICAIAVVCSDFGALFQGAWKTWFILWNLIIIAATVMFFLFHLFRFGRGNVSRKSKFLIGEIIFNIVVSLSLLLSAVAYLRVSVDPNTNKSYSLSVVIIAGVCSIVASIMYGISAFLSFNERRNLKDYAATHHRRSSALDKFDVEDGDDEDEEHFDHTTTLHQGRATGKTAISKRLDKKVPYGQTTV